MIVKEVGRGSTGVVYLSHDPYYRRDVAIKVTPTQPGPYSGELAFAMGDGSTFTVPVSGEAVGETDRTSAPPAQTTDTGQIPNTDVPPTDAVPTGVPTQVPSGYEIP